MFVFGWDKLISIISNKGDGPSESREGLGTRPDRPALSCLPAAKSENVLKERIG